MSGTTRLLITILVFIVLEVGSLAMVMNSGTFQKAKVSGVSFNLFSGIDYLSSHIKYLFNMNEVNIQYQQENLRLNQELHKYKTMVEQHLYSSIEIDSTHSRQGKWVSDSIFSFISANVAVNSTNKLHNYIIIDKGRKDGVETDMGVISSNGVVGIISSVSENYSYAISLLDIKQKLSARISPSNATGTVIWEGRNPNYVTLTEIPLHIEFNKPDTVFTSGFSSIFPTDIPIGSVESSTLEQGSHHKIRVKLFQDFSTLRFVVIVKNNRRNEIDSLIRESDE